jgi:crotonobetainyl-CoA:carnitine CoA-transferase CaiB-like acyl-CoA transferase
VRPLDDIRIVAIEQYGAGPFATMHLAELGAEVIKIEEPSSGGDVGRYVPPYQEGEDSLFFETYNRNKRSLSLDVRTDAGRQVLHDLVRVSDAVFSNLRGDVPAALGLRYADLQHVNPRIVCCSLSGFGMTGPRASQPGYDYILQGMAGWMSLTGQPDGPPTKSGLSLVDFSGGFVAAISLLAGIHAARRTGLGTDCDLSLFDTALSLTGYVATWHLTAGHVPQRVADSGHPSLVPFQVFRAADGWLVIGCAKEKFWQRLAHVLGAPELADDPRFVDFAARAAHKDELIPILESILVTRTASEWLQLLGAAGVPSGPILSLEEAFADEQALARGMVVETEHPRFGVVRQPGSPVRVGTTPAPQRRAPQRNEDADYVLTKVLAYSQAEIESLEGAGAFATALA